MRFILLHVLLILLAGPGTVAIPNKLPAHEALPAHGSLVPIFGSRAGQVGPVPKSENDPSIVKHASRLPPSNLHIDIEKHATVPVPPQRAVPVTHSVTGSVPDQPVTNSDHVHNDHTQAGIVGPASTTAADTAATTSLSDGAEVLDAALGPNACDAGGDCAALGEAVISAAEGPECRALHITGKCSAKCLAALKEALAHKLWNACAARCEIDVVSGAAHRWAELCETRQPTLLDASKEALHIVAAAPGAGRAVQLLILFGVLFTALAFGYRRGMLQGTVLRFQKRLKRRSSERSLV